MTLPTVNPVTNLVKSLVRTLMPMLYSGIASVVAHFGYHVSNAVVVQIVAGGFVGLTIVLHTAEKRWPWVGVLLGYLGAPLYTPPVKVSQAAQLTAQAAEIQALETKVAELSPAAPMPGL